MNGNSRPEGRPTGVGTLGHGSPKARHDGASEHQAAQWVPSHLASRERILGHRPMTVGEVSKVLAAMVGDAPPQEPSSAWCPRCQAPWQERVDMFPRVRIRTDLSWECDWCPASGWPIEDACS